MSKEAVQAAANAAAQNGAARAVSNPLTIGKATSLASEIGLGFLSLAFAATSATYSLERFKAAWDAVKR